jgi:hypothetical protein
MSNPRINKRQREMAKREKAAAKAERRTDRRNDADEKIATTATDQDALIAELAEVHRRFEADEITLDNFIAARQLITERLHIA